MSEPPVAIASPWRLLTSSGVIWTSTLSSPRPMLWSCCAIGFCVTDRPLSAGRPPVVPGIMAPSCGAVPVTEALDAELIVGGTARISIAYGPYRVTTLISPTCPKPKTGSGATRVTGGNCAEMNVIPTITDGVAGIAGVTPGEAATAGRCSIVTAVFDTRHMISTYWLAAVMSTMMGVTATR